ncbi:MAG TPA: choice-of-anchor tandem repeat GloVer-containing protein, partial [Methylocella sp.]|nr:choice-of-anchor tandem repeat GloVer-containing protein [Methylocella sp.]
MTGGFRGRAFLGRALVGVWAVLILMVPAGTLADPAKTVLYSFCSKPHCSDGSEPAAVLIFDSSGNLYGTTVYGGTSNAGTVFKLAPDGTETVLHAFKGSPSDGSNPSAGLIFDRSGNLYGTTQFGGTSNAGTVFKLAPDGTETVLHAFKGSPSDGSNPSAGLI